MKWIDKLERKYWKFGISNLTTIIIACYVAGYFLERTNSNIMSLLSLSPGLILKGQIWRLVTWMICSPTHVSFGFFLLSIVFFYYPIGKELEIAWGRFHYTLYILMGMIFTVIGAFILYFLTGGIVGGGYGGIDSAVFNTYYISLSVCLAYAMTYPEARIHLWFVIPIKMKWLGYLYFAYIVYDIYTCVRYGQWFLAIPMLASIINFVVFYFGTDRLDGKSINDIRRKRKFQKAVSQGQVISNSHAITKHKCAICGRTEKDDPNLEFRFCSKCNGNYEYCNDHLFTHQHIQ